MRTVALALLAVLAAGPLRAQSYAPAASGAADSTRERGARTAAPTEGTVFGTAVPASLSIRGLPPVEGTIVISADSGLIFRSADASVVALYPIVGVRRGADGQPMRASTVTLAAVDEAAMGTVYLIRLHGAILQTTAPGPLLELTGTPAWLDSLAPTVWPVDAPLIETSETAAQAMVDEITSSSYADTLYALFGRPARPAGLVGERGREAGRIGEYLQGRDSLALDPARMSTRAQLRHVLAHELAHRWQRELPARVAAAWGAVPRITDPKRYGHTDRTEQQAEAVAFAVHYLQTTAGTSIEAEAAAALLARYERFVPGTGLMVRELLRHAVYKEHPLR